MKTDDILRIVGCLHKTSKFIQSTKKDTHLSDREQYLIGQLEQNAVLLQDILQSLQDEIEEERPNRQLFDHLLDFVVSIEHPDETSRRVVIKSQRPEHDVVINEECTEFGYNVSAEYQEKKNCPEIN